MKYFLYESRLYELAAEATRYLILDESGHLLEDCHGYGFRSSNNARSCIAYKIGARTIQPCRPVRLRARPRELAKRLRANHPDLSGKLHRALHGWPGVSWPEFECEILKGEEP